ncbi:Serine carboxypeptidase-like 5 [Dendrobium catenatum]|uniref:Serine carboxypeptidase-like 5 n=1 Tax=Dendrobium catenatum TaxID=906689 RepID=A0A2I0XHD9_9ASPA|nr:Serine carboxypeptidase-like 5 [Dendrobium catenatum]
MATEGCRPPISGGSTDVRRSSTRLSHGSAKSLYASLPAFGDILSSLFQGSISKFRSGKGVLEDNPSSKNLKNRDLIDVKELAATDFSKKSYENDSDFYGKQNAFKNDTETLNDVNSKEVQAMDNSRTEFLNNFATEGNEGQILNDMENVRECNNRELGSCNETVNVISETTRPILQQNGWAKMEHIKVAHLDLGDFKSEDGEHSKAINEENSNNNIVSKEVTKDNFGYGPWLQVNYGKKRSLFKNQVSRDKEAAGKKISESIFKKQIWKEVEAMEIPNKVVQFSIKKGVTEDAIKESSKLQHPEISSEVIMDKRWFLFSSAAFKVTHLPGLLQQGALPFHLETGYIEVDEVYGVELFYYFIESERNPSEDPLLVWLSGGPGCSAFNGLSLEIVGAGFSFSNHPQGYESGDKSSSKLAMIFLRKWLIDHQQFLSNPLYIAGDSYAGKVVPLVVHNILNENDMEQQPKFNIQGYMIGNPMTGELIDFNARVPFAFGMGIISDELYQRIDENCKGEDYKNPKSSPCASLLQIFDNEWVKSLKFSITDRWRSWHVGGQVAGYTESYSNNLTFATVKGAGHMAPVFKAKECLAMFRRWISHKLL